MATSALALNPQKIMHYKNGREAKDGDRVIQIQGKSALTGILHSTNAQATSCNGRLAVVTLSDPYVNVGDCLHVDDVASATVPDSTKG